MQIYRWRNKNLIAHFALVRIEAHCVVEDWIGKT